MPNDRSEPPTGLIDAVRAAAAELLPARLHTIRTGFAAGAATSLQAATQVAEPLEQFTLGLDRVLDRSGLRSALPAGWITLVSVANNPVALADSGTGDAASTVRSMNYGPFVQGLAAINAADSVRAAAPAGSSFETRVLRVPALFLTALWLHSDVDDVVIPAAPAPAGLVAGRRYAGDQLIEGLTPLALSRVESNDRGTADQSGAGGASG